VHYKKKIRDGPPTGCATSVEVTSDLCLSSLTA
jgi:hypothetical protein